MLNLRPALTSLSRQYSISVESGHIPRRNCHSRFGFRQGFTSNLFPSQGKDEPGAL